MGARSTGISERITATSPPAASLRLGDPHIRPMNLTDEETLALVNLLERTIRDDPYPLSPRIRVLKAILDKLVEPRPGTNRRRRRNDTRHGREASTGGAGEIRTRPTGDAREYAAAHLVV